MSAAFQEWPGSFTPTNRYEDFCAFYSSAERQFHMVMGNAFHKGSAAFSSREGVSPIIWNKEHLLCFGMHLREQRIIQMYVLQLYTEPTALPPNAICLNYHEQLVAVQLLPWNYCVPVCGRSRHVARLAAQLLVSWPLLNNGSTYHTTMSESIKTLHAIKVSPSSEAA